MDLRDSTSMRNYELLKEIHKMAYTALLSKPDEHRYTLEDIVRVIEEERPEVMEDGK